jgi:hypothetical protein
MASATETFSVKLSKEDMEALDRVVALSGVGNTRGGRSTAVRMLMRPFLECIKLNASGAGDLQMAKTLYKEMYAIIELCNDAGKVERMEKQQMVFGDMEVSNA